MQHALEMRRPVRDRRFESAVGREGRRATVVPRRRGGSARSFCVAGSVRASVASWVAPGDRGGSGGTGGLLVGVALLHERDRARGQGHDQQDREADRERPQPAGRSTCGSQLVIVCGVGGIEKLALERTSFAGMGGGPVERGVEACAAVQLGGIAPGGVPVDRRDRDAVVEPRPSRSSSNQLRKRGHSRSNASCATSAAPSPVVTRRRVTSVWSTCVVSELHERHPPADVVGAFAGLGQAQQEQPTHALVVGCQLPVRVLGEPGHRAADAAGVVVAGVGEHPSTSTHPGLQQCRGQQRERARLVRHVGRRSRRQARPRASTRRAALVPRSRRGPRRRSLVRRAAGPRRAAARTPGTRRSGRSSPRGHATTTVDELSGVVAARTIASRNAVRACGRRDRR